MCVHLKYLHVYSCTHYLYTIEVQGIYSATTSTPSPTLPHPHYYPHHHHHHMQNVLPYRWLEEREVVWEDKWIHNIMTFINAHWY